MEKTNVMRILEQKKIPFIPHEVEGNPTDGMTVATLLNAPAYSVFKTLVTVGSDLNHYVFVVPVSETLDLKKGAKAMGVKSIAMLKQKELFPLTGYVHGGCSPIGMKKPFKTCIDETAQLCDTIFFSAGKIGCQVELSPKDLEKIIRFSYADITDEI